MAFNDARFDDPLYTGRGGSGAGLRGGALDIPTFDNPLEGAVSLLVSPGKGILFFAPPVLLALWGARPLWRRAPWLGGAVLATAALHFGMISSLSFFGGDWAWGPRYLVVLLPLAALAWACIPGEPLRRAPVRALIGAGVAVQLLAIGVDHQRYFFERSLPPFFWLEDWSYFRGSALLARPAELVDVLDGDEGLPGRRFSPTPYAGSTTYAMFGPNASNTGSDEWMRAFRVFYLPRPWPLWMSALEPDRRPFDPLGPALVCLLLLAAGVVLALKAARAGERAAAGP